MKGILLVLVLAIIVEAIVEYAKSIYKLLAEHGIKRALLQAAAVIVSVLLCFAANADLFGALGIEFRYAWIGIVLTGVFASRGANYVSDLIGKLQAAKEPSAGA